MLPGLELMGCQGLAVPIDVMRHVVHVESSGNPFAIGVVGGRLRRQPRTLGEAVATARMLKSSGYNFSVGLAQVNRYNLDKFELGDLAQAFDPCRNLVAGSRILADCQRRAGGDWGKAFSCYYSGNFTTGFRHGYVQRVLGSMRAQPTVAAIPLAGSPASRGRQRATPSSRTSLLARRSVGASSADVQAIASDFVPPVAPAQQPAPEPAASDAAFVF